MLKTYFITALRDFKRDKFFTILNLTGLTVGVTCFILLALFVRHELSYDRFHKDVDRIYVLAEKGFDKDGPINNGRYLIGQSKKLQELVPEMSEMTHIMYPSEELIKIENESFYEEMILPVDNNFFNFFNFEILQGEVDFSEPNRVVISENYAKRYFESKSPIGDVLNIGGVDHTIVAVIENTPVNTHIKYELLVSNKKELEEGRAEFPNENGGSVAFTAFKLPKDQAIDKVSAKIDPIMKDLFRRWAQREYEGDKLIRGLYFVPLKDVHLKSLFSWTIFPFGDIRYVYIFGSIAILILLIACLNYVNLATARSLRKMKEVGVRKVLGADRKQIIKQNIIESMLYAFTSVVIAFAIAERLLPTYSNLIDRKLELTYLSFEFVVFVIGLGSLVGICTGLYPALRMGQFKAIKALSDRDKSKAKVGVRRGLVTFQFFIAQGLIVATIIIQSQLSYLQNKDLGYVREELLYIDASSDLKENAAVFSQELQAIPGIESVSLTNAILNRNSVSFKPMTEITGFEDSDENEYFVYESFSVDTAFIKTMGMELISGGDFNSTDQIAPETAMIVNETFVEKLGWDQNPIGQKFEWYGEKFVIGVVKDFHNESLKSKVQPAAFLLSKNPYQFFNIKLRTNNVREATAAIEEKWNEFVPEKPMQLNFYDQVYNNQYADENRLGRIFNFFSGVAITISILGLIGLTAFSAEQRLKEFGIRKVLGAEIPQLVFLLSKEFVLLILLAFAVASPIAYLGLQGWLDGFFYKVNIGPVTFIYALLITLCIALISMTYQFRKITSVNPSDILRQE